MLAKKAMIRSHENLTYGFSESCHFFFFSKYFPFLKRTV